MLCLIYLIIEAVMHEAYKLRYHCLRSLAFEKLKQVVITRRRIFDQNLSDDTHSRFSYILMNRNCIEFLNHLLTHSLEGMIIRIALLNKGYALIYPLLMKCINLSCIDFIRTHPIYGLL